MVATVRGARHESWLYGGMALALFACLFYGFAPSWFLRGWIEPRFPLRPVHWPALVHGILASAWFALFMAQALLWPRNPRAHMRMGQLGVPLGLALAASGIVMSAHVAALERATPKLSAMLFVSVWEFLLFGVLVIVALRHRTDRQTHKRLLLIATIALATAGFGRFGLPKPFTGLRGGYMAAALFFVPLLLWDLTRLRRLHRATVFGIAAVVAVWSFNLTIRKTQWWLNTTAAVAQRIA